MTKPKLRIADNLFLPLDTVTSTLLILGGKGMGKTNLGRVIVEEINRADMRWAALDPLGVWWGLRYSKDGKGPGIECVILGGPHGDIPIEPTGGGVAADLVVDEKANVIIDFSRKPTGEVWGVGEKIRFVTDYGRRLFQRQGELVNGHRREPLFQLMDEASRYIPQIIPAGSPDLAKCVSVWDQIAEEGRNFGIGLGLLTQRSARINKSVTEIADALFSFRIVGPNSIKAITDWLGEHVPKEEIKQHVETVRSLERGRCLVVSPGWLHFEGIANIRAGETFDSSATPKPGERAQKVTGEAAKPDLAAYLERMKETIERAKENDPTELRRRVKELSGKLANFQNKPPVTETKKAAAPDPALKQQLQTANRAVQQLQIVMEEAMRILTKISLKGFEGDAINTEEMEAALKKAAMEIGGIAKIKIETQRREFEVLKKECERIMRKAKAIIENDNTVTIAVTATKNEPVTVRELPQVPVAQMKRREPREPVAPGEVRLGRLHRELAGIMAGYYPDAIKKTVLAVMVGMTHGGGGWSKRLSECRVAGLIEDLPGGLVKATESCAREYAGAFQAPNSTEEVLKVWENKLGGKPREMLNVLIAQNGEAITRQQLAEAVGMEAAGGGFSKRLSELRTTGLLSEPGSGLVAANKEVLFLNGEAA